MKCPRPLVLVIVTLSMVSPMPSETTTARSPTHIGETIKQLTSQLMEINATSPDIVTLDTRTPPKVKQQVKKRTKPPAEEFESSHAGVAIPIDEDDMPLEETTKKLSFYKIERPTTNSGLSTWILLSGQAASTTKPTRKPTVKPAERQNATVMVEPNKVIKPLFKKRLTTTRKPPTTRIPDTTTTPKETSTKLTKIKASVLNSAVSKKVTTSTAPTTKKIVTTTTAKTTTTVEAKTTINVINNNTAIESTTTNSSSLPLEAKDGETDLATPDDANKKPRRPSNKRKKNKNRRRRPSASDKSDSNSTKIEKHKNREKPIGTQLYNYLSREVMPTVGVGLVGLMVTAGLASYFLYPFGAARRTYEVDRRDKEGSYYYSDEYSGGIAEEEAIGKVIAGMPSNSLYGNNYKTPTSRHSFNNVKARPVDHRISQINPNNDYQPVNSYKEVIEQSKESAYAVDDKQFVVGNVPTEEVTPVAVPEHGPRSLKIRRRRRALPPENDNENEINSNEFQSTTTNEDITTTFSTVDLTASTAGPVSSTTSQPEKFTSFIHMFKELLHLKVNLGLQLIQNATQAVSRYVSHVQRRLDEHYKNYTRTNY